MFNKLAVPTVERTALRIIPDHNPTVVKDIGDRHVHNEYETLLSLEGKQSVIINESEYTLDVGDILFINRRVPHKTITHPGARIIILQFKNPFDDHATLNELPMLADFRETNDVRLFKEGDTHHAQLKNYITAIADEYDRQDLAYEEFIRGYLQEMVAYLYRHRVLIHHNITFSRAEMQRITPALEYIRAHYHEPIALENISKLLLIDKSHFCRIFKKCMNMTFIDYLNSVRIYHAEALLTKTKKSVTEIAFKVGFSSTAYFIKAFKRYNFCTPSKYRKMYAESHKSQ